MRPSPARAVAPSSSRAQTRRDVLTDALRYATLIWVVGMATVFPLGNDALEAVSVLTFDRLAFLFVGALLAADIARAPGLLRRLGRVEWLMALWLGVAILSWAATLSGKAAADVKRDVELLLTSLLMPYAAFVIARHGGWSRPQRRAAALMVVAAAGVFLIAVGLVQGLVDWRFLVAEAHRGIHRSRSRGPFANALPYSVVLALLFPVVVALWIDAPRGWRRLNLIGVSLGLVETLLLAQIRIVWIALPVALLYLAAVCRPARRFAAAIACAILAAIGVAWAEADLRSLASSDGAARQPSGSISERLRDTHPAYNRVAVYGTALNMIVHRPLTGFGFGAHTFERRRGDYLASCCGVSPGYAIECAVPHNEVLNILVLVGAAGLLVFLALARELWRLLRAARAAADPFDAALAAGAQAGFIVLVITGQLHDVMYLSAAQVLFFFFAGLAVPGAVASEEPA